MEAFSPFALKPFDLSRSEFTNSEKAYFSFYGLDFPELSDVHHRFGYCVVDSFTISTHYFFADTFTETVVVNHGYMDHSGLYVHLIRVLLENNFNVLINDHPGHGLSSGEQAGIESYQKYQVVLKGLIEKFEKDMPQPWYMVGQSMGGAISADFILHNNDKRFEKLVLLAPLVTPMHWETIKIQLQGLKHFLNGVPRKFRDSSLDREFLQFLEKDDPLQTKHVKTTWVKALLAWQDHIDKSYPSELPTLLVQGDNDNTIDWRYGLEVYKKKFTELNIKILASANHHLVCETTILREQAFKHIIDFIKS